MDTVGIENFISVKYTEGPKLAASLEEHVKEYDIDVMNLQRAKRLEKKDLIEVELEKAEPGVKYLLSVSNENMLDFDFDMGSLLGEGLGIEGTEEEISFDYNAYPYNLEIEQVQLPQDEDGLPLNMEEQDTADQANKIDELLSEEDE